MRRLWRWFLAWWRLDLQVVCEESAKLGDVDYHDYHDDADGIPVHFGFLYCERCGKRFLI